MQPSKAVIPLGGSGSRMNPVTGGQYPKELLTLGDQTVLERLVSEFELCGVESILFILNRNNPETEDFLSDLAAKFDIHFHKIHQDGRKGLGDAVLYAEGFIKRGESFYLGFPDDVFISYNNDIPGIAYYKGIYSGTPIIMATEVPDSEVSKYGILDTVEVEVGCGVITKIVEKPTLEEAPSNLAIVGRYILDWRIFHFLKKSRTLRKFTASGELDLSNALSCYSHAMYVTAPHHCAHFDCGCPDGYNKAVLFVNQTMFSNPNSEGDKPCIS